MNWQLLAAFLAGIIVGLLVNALMFLAVSSFSGNSRPNNHDQQD